MRLRTLLAMSVTAIVLGGCASHSPATAPPPPTSAGPDTACVAARKAEQNLQAHQGADQSDESAIDEDFMNFAGALSTAAQQERDPAKAKVMTALANDYTALVQSQSGAADLPDMNALSDDGAAFDKACA